jgi:small GTP-binding protein
MVNNMSEIIQLAKKILLIGDPSVGKTSLVRKFVLDIFDDKYLTTLGTKVTNKTMIFSPTELSNKKVELKMLIWDVMGQKEYKMIQESAYQGSSGAIIVADLSRKETIDHLGAWVSDLYNISGVVPVLFVGNKMDLVDQNSIELTEMDNLSMSYEAPYFLTSAKTGENVENAFKALGNSLINTSIEELNQI